ncbi:MAG: hypothetical protein ACKO3P_04435, partial [Planctomycetaceae bacterium]
MLFTRTIRRKMLLGVAMVLAMLVVLSAGSLLGLRAYRKSIDKLDTELSSAPRKAELIEAIARLQIPLQRQPRDEVQAGVLHDLVCEQATAVDSAVEELHRRMGLMPGGPGHQQQFAILFPLLTGLQEQSRTI